MAQTAPLFSLIKALSKSEKRYFRLSTAMIARQQNYVSLFEALDQTDVYDQQQLKNKFYGKPFTRQLHVAKNYLYGLLLKSLRNYHYKHSSYAQIKSCLIDVEILYRKDLLTHCLKSLNKAERLAGQIGDQRSLLEVLNWRRKVLLNMQGDKNTKIDLKAILNQEQEALDNLKYENLYWDMAINMDRGEGIDISLPPPLLKDDSHARTIRSRILHFHLKYIYETMAGNPDQAEQSIDQLITYLEENPHHIKDDPGPYISALNNKIGFYLNQKRHAEVPAVLEKIRGIPFASDSPVSIKLLVRTFNVELEALRDSGQFQRGVAMVPRVRAFLKDNHSLIPGDYRILLHYQFAYLYFMVGAFNLALKDINVVLSYRYNSQRADVVGYAQFLNLIIHYELGNFTVMKYAVDASRRFLKKRGGLMDFENVLLKLFSKLSTQPQSQHRELLIKTHQQLFGNTPMIDDSQLDYLDFNYWLTQRKAKRF